MSFCLSFFFIHSFIYIGGIKRYLIMLNLERLIHILLLWNAMIVLTKHDSLKELKRCLSHRWLTMKYIGPSYIYCWKYNLIVFLDKATINWIENKLQLCWSKYYSQKCKCNHNYIIYEKCEIIKPRCVHIFT